MKQLYIRSGRVILEQVPPPPLDVRGILVDVLAAVISVGTESRSVQGSRLQPVRQLVRSPSFRREVLRRLRAGTFLSTAKRQLGLGFPTTPPRRSLGAPTGYSCAGRVREVGEQVRDIQPGERVACAGSPHAELAYVPQNLFVPVPDGVSDAEAAFVALGSIALHSVRQAEVHCGETVVVMGLGVIGQLVAQLARVGGARTIVADLLPERLELACRVGAHLALDPTGAGMLEEVLAFTGGLGADAVLLCMGGESARPIQQALELIRERGRLVVVGTPLLNIPRGPFYQKEVELRIARSYGPGRYDPAYEEEGQDYPAGYIRWTERRNMAEFLRLVAEKRVDVASLVTHRFPFAQAEQAYKTAMEGGSGSLGVVLLREEERAVVTLLPESPAPTGRLGVAVVGAGSFARSFHLPNAARSPQIKLEAIVDKEVQHARQVASELGAELGTGDIATVLRDPAVDLVIITTPHDLHASQTIAALEAGKAVFCEKPMGMTPAEVDQVVDAVEHTGGFYAIGFNRRFAPTVVRARELLAGRKGPLALNYRVMGTFVPADHWIYDPVRGGGRIVGEMCHFYDLLCYLVGSPPLRLTAAGGTLSHPGTRLHDNMVCTLTFADGSIASLVYGDLGRPQFPKERLEVFAGEGMLVVDDFVELRVEGFSRQRGMRLPKSDKGHRAELEAIAQALLEGRPSPIDAQAGRLAMHCAFRTLQALASGAPQDLEGGR
ncbi:MAG: bi-domain-containing oxidoreductase [Anaerolineae bacterium]|nr:bi-domain-containing oxidoreductase [Anaerolineae bacterium]